MDASRVACFLAAACVLSVFAWPAVSHWRERSRRCRRLLARSALDEAEWFARYLPVGLPVQTELKQILGALGRDLGVEWTRLRPDDRFDEVLAVRKFASIFGDLDYFSIVLEEWINKKQLQPDVRYPLTLGELLNGLADALESRRHSGTMRKGD